MKDQVISFDTAKLAKEIGIENDLLCPGCYVIGFRDIQPDRKLKEGLRSTVKGQFHLALAPTQSLLQKWLREEKDLVMYIDFSYNMENIFVYTYAIYNLKILEFIKFSDSTQGKTKYEEALEAALVEGLNYIKQNDIRKI